MTTRRVVALFQSLLSSRHRMMYSRCAILARTMPSTWRAAVCRPMLRLPGAGEMRPFLFWGFLRCVLVLSVLVLACAQPPNTQFSSSTRSTLPCSFPQMQTQHTHKQNSLPSPGVSMIVRLGQYLYSMRTTTSLAQNCCSASRRWFSAAIYSCSSSSETSTSPSSAIRKHAGRVAVELYCFWGVVMRVCFV